jgi:ADP-L-glycero-D-manno-heptose 6-epimerase
MNILVTGWNGKKQSFIPKSVLMHLKELGHNVDCWVYTDDYKNEFYGWVWSEEYKKYVHATSTKGEIKISPITKYELIIHLGATVDRKSKDPEFLMQKNFDFSLWLLNECQKHGIKLHYASDMSIYGDVSWFPKETSGCRPSSNYDWSKYLFDRIVEKHLDTFATPVVGFRYSTVYGEYESHKGFDASIVHKVVHRAPYDTLIHVPKEYEDINLDLISIEDVCKVHEKMLDSDYKGLLNVGCGELVSLSDFTDKVSQITGNDIEFDMEQSEIRGNNILLDTTLLHKLIDIDIMQIDEYIEKQYGL